MRYMDLVIQSKRDAKTSHPVCAECDQPVEIHEWVLLKADKSASTWTWGHTCTNCDHKFQLELPAPQFPAEVTKQPA